MDIKHATNKQLLDELRSRDEVAQANCKKRTEPGWVIFSGDGVAWNAEAFTAVLIKGAVFEKYFNKHNPMGGKEFLGVGYEHDEWYPSDELCTIENLGVVLTKGSEAVGSK